MQKKDTTAKTTSNTTTVTAPTKSGVTTVTAPPKPGVTTGLSDAKAIGMVRLSNDRGYAAYRLTIDGDRVVAFEALCEDPSEPVLSSKDAAWNLVRRATVEAFWLEGQVQESAS